MTAAPAATDPTPWAADSLTYAQSPLTKHAWSLTAVELISGAGPFAFDAWGVTVDIDARRIPLAIATFKVPTAQVDATAGAFDPAQATFITLNAGWQRDSGPDLHPVFAGGLLSMESENGVTTCRAVTMDGILGKAGPYTVSSGYTSVAQVVTDFSHIMVINTISLTTEGVLPTPTAGQLAAFRSMSLGTNAGQMEALAQMALSLGCWIRGSLRTSTWLTLSARYDSGTAIDLTGIVGPAKIITGDDDYARGVSLTAVWNDGATAKQAQAYFGYASSPLGFEQSAAAEVTANYRPPGGVLSASDPVGQAYAAAYGTRRWRATATGRALWWLAPRQVATFGGKTGQLDAIVLNVDAGTATYTIRPTSAY